jgi:RND family efflux transporter MFP subunit
MPLLRPSFLRRCPALARCLPCAQRRPGRCASLALLVVSAALVLPGWAQAAEFIGIVHPQRDLRLSVHVAGVVEQVLVQVGQRVAAGQVILRQEARLQTGERERRRIVLADTSELRSVEQRGQMIAGLVRDAEALYERAGTVSRDEVVKLRLELEAASGRAEQLREAEKRERAELDLAEREVALRELRAPIAGVVTSVERQAGEWAAPGEALVRLVDETVCELRVNVSPGAARKLSAGAAVPVRLDDSAVPGPVNGRVIYVAPVVDAASALVEVRVQIANAERRIRPGVKARIRVEDGS